MRQAAAQMKKLNTSQTVRDSPADLKSQAQAKSAASGNENDFATDFVIGALLYSLFGSSRCEAVN
ncbi:MAG: hypothetical protein ACRD82_11805, partial [Blastocatellia bacterium]